MQNNQNHYPLSNEASSPVQIAQAQLPQNQSVVYPQLQPTYQMGQPYPGIQMGQQVMQSIPQQSNMPYQQAPYAQPYMGQIVNYQQPTSRYAQILNCQVCRKQIQSTVHYEAGNGAYVVGGLLAAVGLWLGCCLIPCFMQDCKDAVHFCPQCTSQLGRRKFLFE